MASVSALWTRPRCEPLQNAGAESILKRLRCSHCTLLGLKPGHSLRARVSRRNAIAASSYEGNLGTQVGRPASNEGATSQNRGKLWLAAIKPPMYSVGIIPVLAGAAVSYYSHGVIDVQLVLRLVFGSSCVIAWLNLSNDAFDADTGVDATKAESVVNLTGNKSLVHALAIAFLIGGLALLIPKCCYPVCVDARVPICLSLAIGMGYLYQGPPFRLSYLGLGEPLCFLAFGPLAIPAFYLVHSSHSLPLSPIPPLVWLCSAVIGATTSAVLFCSHFHQCAGDLAAGKLSPVVRLGTERASRILQLAIGAIFGLFALSVAASIAPPLLGLCCAAASFPLAARLVAFVQTFHSQPGVVYRAKFLALRLHIAMGVGLCIGCILSSSAG